MFSLKNSSIRIKLGLLTGIFVFGFMVFGIYSYSTMNNVEVNGPIYQRIVQGKDLVADILPPPEYILESYLNVWQLVDALDAKADRATIKKLLDDSKRLRDDYDTRHEYWLKELPEGNLKQTLTQSSYNAAVAFYKARDENFIPAIQSGDIIKARTIVRTTLQPRYEEHRAFIDQVVTLSDNLNKQEEQNAASTISLATLLLILIGVVIALTGAGLGFLISSSITKPLGKGVAMIQEMAKGHLGLRLKMDRKDEVGVLAQAMDQFADDLQSNVIGTMKKIAAGDLSSEVVPKDHQDEISPVLKATNESLQGLVAEARMLTKAAVEGKLATRGEVTRFHGAYREIVQGVNDTLNAVIGPLKMAATYVDQIARGDIPPKIADTYNGDFNEIKNNLNQCVDAVNLMIADANTLSKAAVEGKLATRADATKHQGDFRKIVQGVNDTLDAVIGPLNVAADYVDRIAKGDIPPKITDAYHGDFNTLKNNLNICIDSVKALVEDVHTLSAAALAGNLDQRADATKHHGDFQTIVQGMNETLDALINPLKRTIDHLEHLAAGKVDDQITRQYPGELNRLKLSFNSCFTSVNALIADANVLSAAAIEGRLSTRADVSKHKGDFRKIVQGVNQTLDAVIEPVTDSAAVLAEMAKGNLTVRMQKDYQGDYQMLKESINTVATSLAQALIEVTHAVAATASASSQISSSTEEMATGAEEQTVQAAQVASAVEEMTATILDNSKNASHASETAKRAKVSAEQGGVAVKDTIEGMRRIASTVDKAAKIVRELGDSSSQIGEIATVIDDIADQTNLLALNAAIEAARAGEQGRGFAVVADEVRKLAERTTKATKEIAVMIKKIQVDTQGAVTSMEEGTTEVERGIVLADKAGVGLKDIVSVSEQVTDMVTQIAAASEEQSLASEEISRNVTSISSVSNQTSIAIQQVARASEDLNRLAEKLQTLVSAFRVEAKEEVAA